jgi:hypothetical protein
MIEGKATNKPENVVSNKSKSLVEKRSTTKN